MIYIACSYVVTSFIARFGEWCFSVIWPGFMKSLSKTKWSRWSHGCVKTVLFSDDEIKSWNRLSVQDKKEGSLFSWLLLSSENRSVQRRRVAESLFESQYLLFAKACYLSWKKRCSVHYLQILFGSGLNTDCYVQHLGKLNCCWDAVLGSGRISPTGGVKSTGSTRRKSSARGMRR